MAAQMTNSLLACDRSVRVLPYKKPLHCMNKVCKRQPNSRALVSLNFTRFSSVTAHGSRSRGILYDDSNTYVLLEPGEDEVFVSIEQLKSRLKAWLERWPEALPRDLAKFETLEGAVTHLVNNACELDVGEGFGSIQWFQVSLQEREN